MPYRVAGWLVAIVAALAAAGCAAPVREGAVGDGPLAADAVKVYTGTREILTGPFKVKGLSPQQRPEEFKAVRYPAVYVENEYLRCCVLPTVGGRLYEVYNKASKSQVFYVNPYLETYPDDYEGAHPWNLGGVEVNFPYFHHGNTYNDRWPWAEVRRGDGAAGVAMGYTSRPTMQRAVFRVLLRPGAARVDLEYRFENQNPYPWGLAAWIDTMHPKTMDTQFILPVPWVAPHGFNANRVDLFAWPVRNGVDLSWQKNVPAGTSLSEFGFMPRLHFHGCYDEAADRGAVRIFDPATLPAAKLWTQSPPVTPDQYYQHFEIWTATSAVMEDPGRQAELSAYAAADSWQQVWGIGGFVFANADLALNLVRRGQGKLLAGVCGTRRIPGCAVSLREGLDTFHREPFDLDPAKPWRKLLAAPAGDVTMEIVGPDGASLARYELREDELPQEEWRMPRKPRWAEGLGAAYHEEDYSTLWRRRDNFLDGAINRYKDLLKKSPGSTSLSLDLARACLKDEQVRQGSQYLEPGPAAEADAARRRDTDLATAAKLLADVLAENPRSAHAHFYLGLVLERQGKTAEALAEYRAAAKEEPSGGPAAVSLAEHLLRDRPAEALALARQAAAAYPASTPAHHLLMAALTATGKPGEAAAIGRKLLQTDPANPLTARLMAAALAKAGSAAEAERYVKETDRLLAGDAKAREALAADLRRLGQ